MSVILRSALFAFLIFILSGCGMVKKTQLEPLTITVNGIKVAMVRYQDGDDIYPQAGGEIRAYSQPEIKIKGLKTYIGSNYDYGLGITVLNPYYKGKIKSLVAKKSEFDLNFLFTSTCMMYLNSDTTFKYGQSSPYNVHFTPLPLRLNGKHVFAFAIGKSVLFNKREDKDFQAPDFVGAISFDVIGGDMNVICDKEIKLQLKEPIVPGGNTLEQFRVFNLEKTNLSPIISWSGAPINTTNYLLKVNKMVKEEGELKEKVVWELLLPGNVDNYLEYGENIDNAIVETPPEELEPDTPYVINLVALNEKQQPFFIALGFFILTNYEEM